MSEYKRRHDLVPVEKPNGEIALVDRREFYRRRPTRHVERHIIEGLPAGGSNDARLNLAAALINFAAKRRFG